MAAAAAAGLVLLLAGCSVADLEFHPGMQFGLNQGERTSPLVENLDEPYYTDPINWKGRDLDYDDDDANLRGYNFLYKLLEIKQELEGESTDGSAPRPKSRRRHLFEEGGALRPPGPNLGQYRRDMELAAAVAGHHHHHQLQNERVRDELDAMLQQRQQEALNVALQAASKIFGNVDDEYSDNIGQALPVNEAEENTVGSMGSMGYQEGLDNEEYQFKEGEQFPNRFKDVRVVEDPTQFAYAPPDPRFYEGSGQNDMHGTSTTVSAITKQAEVGPKVNINIRSDTDNADQDNTVEGIIASERKQQDNTKDVVVVKSPPDPDDTTTVYIIAMVAGISAAATVGLIAIGIGWFNYTPDPMMQQILMAHPY